MVHLGAWVVAFACCGPLRAGPIHSDVALTPHKGGSIFRLQYSYSEADGRGETQQVHTSGVRGTYVFGLEQNLALILTVPYVNRQVDRVLPKLGRVEEAHDGIADFTILAKYRFWQHDPRPLETARWALLGGLNVRSGDSDFSSDSYDPILGTVFTWRRDRVLLDADLIYQFNTGRDRHRHDVLRYDLACSYRLFPALAERVTNYEWNVVAELNGRYTADGSHEVFLSPGLQLVTSQWVFETSIQLPVVQALAGDAPETDYRLVVGVRYQW
ncbi:MAG: transporter [Planctomycetes bacterium]|nr:transporter [Planctomycetota bacterium]